MKHCLYCNKELSQNQRNNTYCSVECSIKAKKDKKINDWLNGKFDGLRGKNSLSTTIREYLLETRNYSCELCGWNKINPTTGKVPLDIHHKDGNYLNNNIDNLQVLCPNCHSLTPNYKSLNKSDRERLQNRKNYCIDCGTEISQDALRCRTCEGKHRVTKKPVSREELKEMIRTKSFVSIGEEFGVSDNAIKKWCIQFNLPSKKRDIKNICDEDWEKI